MTGRSGSRSSPAASSRSRRTSGSGTATSRARRGTGTGPSRRRGRGAVRRRRPPRPARGPDRHGGPHHRPRRRHAAPGVGRPPARRRGRLRRPPPPLARPAGGRRGPVRHRRRPAGLRAGPRRRALRRLRRGAAHPADRAVGRPGLDLRPQRQRPRHLDPADARSGPTPASIADPAGAARQLAPVLGLDEAGGARACCGPRAGSCTWPARSATTWPTAVRDLDLDGVLLSRGAGPLQPRRRPGRRAPRPGRRRRRRACPASSCSSTTTCRASPGGSMVERDPDGPHHPRRPPPDRPGGAGRRPRAHARPAACSIEVEQHPRRTGVRRPGRQAGIAIVIRPRDRRDPGPGQRRHATRRPAIVGRHGRQPGAHGQRTSRARSTRSSRWPAALEEGAGHARDASCPSRARCRSPTTTSPTTPHPTDLAVDRDPGPVVQRRHDQAGPAARARSGSTTTFAGFGFGRLDRPRASPRVSRGRCSTSDDWSGTSIGSIPIGQGISVTAMQMLRAYNTIANDGVYVPPAAGEGHGRRRRRAPRRPPPARPPGGVAGDGLPAARDAGPGGRPTGTGRAAAIDGYAVAGKTGTARKPQPDGGYKDDAGSYHYIATFAGFLPAEDPELSIIVVIDEPTTSTYAAEVAAPAVRRDRPPRPAASCGVPPVARAAPGAAGRRSATGCGPRRPPPATTVPPHDHDHPPARPAAAAATTATSAAAARSCRSAPPPAGLTPCASATVAGAVDGVPVRLAGADGDPSTSPPSSTTRGAVDRGALFCCVPGHAGRRPRPRRPPRWPRARWRCWSSTPLPASASRRCWWPTCGRPWARWPRPTGATRRAT